MTGSPVGMYLSNPWSQTVEWVPVSLVSDEGDRRLDLLVYKLPPLVPPAHVRGVPDDPIAPKLENALLRRVRFAWGDFFVSLYLHEDDRAARAQLAHFATATAILGWIGRVAGTPPKEDACCR